jgi:hypothetical protein
MSAHAIATARPQVNAATYGGLFVVTMATLMYEIALTRIFSVTMWYHFAFVAISTALFGMTVGALIVYLAPERFPDERLKDILWRTTLLFAVSIALCFWMQLTIPFTPHWDFVGVMSVALTCVIISIPFIFSGIVVCLALTRFPQRVNRLYAADLVGAALGCLALVVLMSRVDGPSGIIIIAAIAAGGALIFAAGADNTKAMWWSLAVMLVFGGFGLMNAAIAERGQAPLRIIWAKEIREPKFDYEKWNSYSRVTVYGNTAAPQAPIGWGMSETLPDDVLVFQTTMTIDGSAATILTNYTGKERETDFLRYDISNLGHYITQNGDVLAIGVGGGRDILSALEFEQNSVTGVEINSAILDTTTGTYGEFTGHLDRIPNVRLVNDEARSYLERNDQRYDMIQISLIDTWAATAAGAYALTENTLYTVEAWETFLDRLEPGGILSVSRWYSVKGDTPLETYRMTALASEVLTRRGVADPRAHIVVYRGPDTQFETSAATLLMSNEPLSAERIAKIQEEAQRLEFDPVITPDYAINESFEGLVAAGGPGPVVDSFNEDISPPTDNRPFFFQMANLRTLLDGTAWSDSHVLQPALVLGVLALVVVSMAAAFIIFPLVRVASKESYEGMTPYYTYFAGIGLGFLLIEISQLQRLSIFLGHPTYALTVVLFSVLLSSGIGSMVSEQIIRTSKPLTLILPLVVLMAGVVAFGILTPQIIDSMRGETTTTRIMVSVALLMPIGFLMGMPFAIGMRAASRKENAPTAFFWGINGATSVCASVLGMVIALLWGISMSYWAGAAAYLLAAGSMAVILYAPLRSMARAEAPQEAATP